MTTFGQPNFGRIGRTTSSFFDSKFVYPTIKFFFDMLIDLFDISPYNSIVADRPDRNRSKSDLTSSINARRVRRVKYKHFNEMKDDHDRNFFSMYTYQLPMMESMSRFGRGIGRHPMPIPHSEDSETDEYNVIDSDRQYERIGDRGSSSTGTSSSRSSNHGAMVDPLIGPNSHLHMFHHHHSKMSTLGKQHQSHQQQQQQSQQQQQQQHNNLIR
ncbi:hypothetical protein BLOT_014635 [Blomia tropicalis]|nr:hypothetical protein BLOT_014635 [Blomia tropicalis]